MKATQDPKYGINDDGQLCNISTGNPIPTDEPIFILRGKDVLAEQTIAYYLTMASMEKHKDAVKHRLNDFANFKRINPDRVKAPDTVYPFPEIS